MASPSEKLAVSLQALRDLQQAGVVAIRSSNLTRTHRERLIKNGFLHEVMKGWYVSARPDEKKGESTAWYTSFWSFCADYLNSRFGKRWSLSPEQSLFLHSGNWAVPQQLLVRSPKGGNKPTKLPHGTSIFDIRTSLPESKQAETIENLRVFSLPASLVHAGPGMFRTNAIEVRATLAMISDASEVLSILLEGGHSTIAGRLAGAFRNIGRDEIADEIIKGMKAADYTVNEIDPFGEVSSLILGAREPSPYVTRIRLMWQKMRDPVIEVFPAPPEKATDNEVYLRNVDATFVTDAYHSLSIEGYRVSEALIERIRDGNWDPDNDDKDLENRNALAARGYYEAFQQVKDSVKKVLEGANAGEIAKQDHGDWYRTLFAPGVTAGIIRPADLAGYRNGPVFIRQSMHVPPPKEAVRDLMPAFFNLLRDEEHPAVRNVLGHFIFVYIHPYFDGNGRMGRFLMNVMMASGGYPWAVIKVDERDAYMGALEQASVQGDIVPFAKFLVKLL